MRHPDLLYFDLRVGNTHLLDFTVTIPLHLSYKSWKNTKRQSCLSRSRPIEFLKFWL